MSTDYLSEYRAIARQKYEKAQKQQSEEEEKTLIRFVTDIRKYQLSTFSEIPEELINDDTLSDCIRGVVKEHGVDAIKETNWLWEFWVNEQHADGTTSWQRHLIMDDNVGKDAFKKHLQLRKYLGYEWHGITMVIKQYQNFTVQYADEDAVVPRGIGIPNNMFNQLFEATNLYEVGILMISGLNSDMFPCLTVVANPELSEGTGDTFVNVSRSLFLHREIGSGESRGRFMQIPNLRGNARSSGAGLEQPVGSQPNLVLAQIDESATPPSPDQLQFELERHAILCTGQLITEPDTETTFVVCLLLAENGRPVYACRVKGLTTVIDFAPMLPYPVDTVRGLSSRERILMCTSHVNQTQYL